jgi:hypothetical protein
MSKLVRKGAGKPIRDAMRAAGLTGPELAEATRRVDPTGKGISPATVGRLAGRGKTARDECRLWTAWLMTEVLDTPIQRLFSMPTPSTSTVERSTPHGDEVGPQG